MVVRKDIDNTTAIVTVTVTRDELKPLLSAELKRFRQRASIKGFRQGQAPVDMVKRMYGSSIFGETLQELLTKQLYDYLRDSKLDVLGQPLPTEDQRPFSYKIDNPEPEYVVNYEVGYVPAFEVKGIESSDTFERLVVSNLEELAETDLAAAQKRMGKRTSPEDDIQDNDIVRIASRELDGKKVKEGGWETTITIFLKTVVDADLKKELLGLKKGDTLRFNARKIEEQQKEEMYRKYILSLPENDDRAVGDMFEGVIEEVSRVSDAELDEEFFNGYFGGGVSSKEEAITALKAGIAQFYETRSNALLMRAFQEHLMAQNQIDLPEAFLKRWLRATNVSELSTEQIDREYPAFADNLRWSLLRDKVKERFGLEVTDEDVYGEYERRVRNYFQVDLPDHIIRESVERLMKSDKDLENTKRDIETDKVFNAIRGVVTLKEKPVLSTEIERLIEDFSKRNQEANGEEAELEEVAG